MNKFDELTKKLSDGMSRRDLLKAMGVTVIAAMLGPRMGGTFDAPDDDYELGIEGLRKYHCSNIYACDNASLCMGSCYCVPTHPRFRDGKGWCHEGIYCDQTIHCKRSRQCKTQMGAGWMCADTCCPDGAVCVPYCGYGTAAEQASVKAAAAQHKGLTSIG